MLRKYGMEMRSRMLVRLMHDLRAVEPPTTRAPDRF
jgi:hypothetical protein